LKRVYTSFAILVTTILLFSLLILSGCIEPSPYCPSKVHVDLSEADSYASNPDMLFRFPLDNISEIQTRAGFAAYGYANSSPSSREYHAAEDYEQIPGTSVHAMADGIVSFSGSRGGYGWLIIIDHPGMNLYSLYGHLSPSRWYIESGKTVEKGQLIGHLGDSDENGGSAGNPLYPHLHFGIRTGQRIDYPSMGEWRWTAGWIKYCPQDLGWLQPSLVIVNQDIPPGGFQKPQAGIFEIWWLELILSLVILTGTVVSFLMLTRKGKPIPSVIYSVFLVLATWFSFTKELRISYALLVLCMLLVIIVGFKLTSHLLHRIKS
jgi:murein DD-endopeptidase MepM/ murein hydrolase activator NlpD